jgi:hypothetical protein
MERTSPSPHVTIGFIDGPLMTRVPDLAEVPRNDIGVCAQSSSATCLHGTFVAGILSAKRGTVAPAICPRCTLTWVEVRFSPLSSTANIVDCIFSYTDRKTDFTEKFFVRCDVTGEFSFLVTKMSPYYY